MHLDITVEREGQHNVGTIRDVHLLSDLASDKALDDFDQQLRATLFKQLPDKSLAAGAPSPVRLAWDISRLVALAEEEERRLNPKVSLSSELPNT